MNLETIQTNFNNMIIKHNAYGSMTNKKIIYIENGYTFIIHINYSNDIIEEIRGVWGERTLLYQICSELKTSIRPTLFKCPDITEYTLENTESILIYSIQNLILFSKYSIEYINSISSNINIIKRLQGFNTIYLLKYKDLFENKMIELFKINNDSTIIISLLQLLKTLMSINDYLGVNQNKYFEILRDIMANENSNTDEFSNYTSIIASNIYDTYK
jgi:hypothetical protein